MKELCYSRSICASNLIQIAFKMTKNREVIQSPESSWYCRRFFIRIAHRWWTTSDIFPCFLRLIIFLNLQVQRFVGRRRPFGTPLPTRRCRASSPSSCIRIPLKNTFTIASLVFARIVSRMDDRFSIFLIQNIQVMLGCGFTWLFLVEILRLGCHYSNYSQI